MLECVSKIVEINEEKRKKIKKTKEFRDWTFFGGSRVSSERISWASRNVSESRTGFQEALNAFLRVFTRPGERVPSRSAEVLNSHRAASRRVRRRMTSSRGPVSTGECGTQ